MLSDDHIIQHHHTQNLPYRDFIAFHWQDKGMVRKEGYLPLWKDAINSLDAEVSHGRWLVRCPVGGCGGAFDVEINEPYFMCCECANVENDYLPYNVRVPANWKKIEEALLLRPAISPSKAHHRNWQRGTTVKALLAAGPFHYSWTTPRTYTTGEVVTAAVLNVDVQDNLNETGPALVTTKGDLVAASAANNLDRLPIGGTDDFVLKEKSSETTGMVWALDPLQDKIAPKGDLLTGSAQDVATALTVGSNGQYLQADSAEATGMKWATGNFQFEGSNTTEATTTSTSVVDLFTVSSLTIAVSEPWNALFGWRRTTGASTTAYLGVKLNTTVVAENSYGLSNSADVAFSGSLM